WPPWWRSWAEARDRGRLPVGAGHARETRLRRGLLFPRLARQKGAFASELASTTTLQPLSQRTFSTSLPKFSPENSLSRLVGKVSRPSTISSLLFNWPLASQVEMSL